MLLGDFTTQNNAHPTADTPRPTRHGFDPAPYGLGVVSQSQCWIPNAVNLTSPQRQLHVNRSMGALLKIKRLGYLQRTLSGVYVLVNPTADIHCDVGDGRYGLNAVVGSFCSNHSPTAAMRSKWGQWAKLFNP
jgi:hypothetical protein